MKNTMKAFVMNDYGSIDKLELVDLPIPKPKENEVLVRVYASSFNPADYALLMGKFGEILPSSGKPHILGLDVSGVVEEVYAGEQDFNVGDQVYAYVSIVKNGSYAEFITIKKDDLAAMPKNLSFIQAAATPLAALTAIQGLYELGELTKNQTVLVQGASGAVGIFALQLALLKDAKVYATCSSESKHLIDHYNLEKIIDYKNDSLTKEITEKVDLILNLAPMDQNQYEKLISLLKHGGKLISAMGMPETSSKDEENFTLKAYTTKRSGERLKEITSLLEAGHITPEVTSIWTLDQVKDLYLAYEKHELYGKAVIEIFG